ncbi:MAG: phosphoadenosine phosphosulfate reductase family protein [Thermosphaera sp.]
MRWAWPRVARIYWDPWRNTPIVKPRQEEIDLYYVVRLSEPGDARPAFQGDVEKLRSAVLYEYGDSRLFSRFFENQFLLLNKVPHWDQMWEVVASGNVLGQLYYDPFREKWRFRLTHSGALLALEEGLVEQYRVDGPVYVGRAVGSAELQGVQAVIVDSKGRVRGLAEKYDGRLIVVKTFLEKPRPVETSGRAVSMSDVIRFNEEGLKALEEASTRFLEKLHGKYRLPVVVSYSGGKDSLIALDLTVRALGGGEMIFNDTGLELPETLRNVEEVSEKYGLRLHVASAGDAFWRGVEVFGPPGKDYRWCCKIAKLVPIAKLARGLWPNGAFNVVGQRAFESLDRAKSPRVWRNKWIPHLVTTSPIQYWSQLAGWLYIFKHDLPFNKLYLKGFDRLGCYLCPSSTLAEFKDVEETYPELWERWRRILEQWRRSLNQPGEWVKLGLWRWLTPATAKKRVARHVQGYVVDWREEYRRRLLAGRIGLAPVARRLVGEELTVEFNKRVLEPSYAEVFKQNVEGIGYKYEEGAGGVVVSSASTSIAIEGSAVTVKPFRDGENLEDLVDVLKIIYRMYGCVKCGSCILWIPKGAGRLTQQGPVLAENLSGDERKRYLEACPISDQLVEKIVVALILDSPKAFKRPSRRRVRTRR